MPVTRVEGNVESGLYRGRSPYGANIRTSRMILLSNNIMDKVIAKTYITRLAARDTITQLAVYVTLS